MQRGAILVVEVVPAGSHDRIQRPQVNDLALRQLGRLVQQEPAVVYVGLQRLQRSQSLVHLWLRHERDVARKATLRLIPRRSTSASRARQNMRQIFGR